MVKKISLTIARSIGQHQLADEEQIEVYSYALELLLGSLLKIVMLLLISGLLNILYPTMLGTISFAGIRFFGGGVHLSTYYRCLAGSLIILLILGKVATYNMDPHFLIPAFFVTFMCGIYSIIRWVPAGTEKKMIIDRESRLKQKIKAMIFLISCFVIIFVFLYFKFYTFANGVAYGLVGAIFFITPLGFLMIESIDRLLDFIIKPVCSKN